MCSLYWTRSDINKIDSVFEYMRTEPIITIIIKNSRGEFFLHQRNKTKEVFPNMYGLGAGGHAEPFEQKEPAAKRELFEETGLTTPVRYLFDILYKDNESNFPVSVYETLADREIENHDLEWQWSGWMKRQEVEELITDKKLMPDTTEIYKRYIKGYCK